MTAGRYPRTGSRMPCTAGWTCYEPGANELQGCGHAVLAAAQPGATGVGGNASGPAAFNALAGRGGVGCVHTHATLVGPASSLAGRLRRGGAIPVPTPGSVQRRRRHWRASGS